MFALAKKYPVKPHRRPTEDRFEYLAHTILYQQLSTKAAVVISRKFSALFNPLPSPPHKGEGTEETRHAKNNIFPTPEKILAMEDGTLRSVGISWAKVKYIKDLASKVHNQEINLANLHKLSDEAVIAELTKVKGIGRWTAEMFLMSALARPDIFSFGDLGLQTAIKKAYGFKKLPSKLTMDRLSKKWSPHKTLAARSLWASLDNE
jgi:DNA-3-methyladenine glycosylase II